MRRWVKRPHRDATDEWSWRYWARGALLALAFNVSIGIALKLAGMSAENLLNVLVVLIIACALWLRWRA
jgi:hypothetical protein